MKKAITILFVVILVAAAAYLIFFESGVVRQSPNKQEPTATPAEDEKAQEKRQEIYHLAARKQKSDIPKFKASLSDSSPMVRLAAARAICEIGGVEQLPEIVKLFKDPDRSVRAAVMQLAA